jgi:hypothetical protein
VSGNSIFKKIEPVSALNIDNNKDDMTSYDSDDEPLMLYSTPKQEDSDTDDDEPLVRYFTPKEDDDDDDKPLVSSGEWSHYTTITKEEFTAEIDDDDEPLMSIEEWFKLKTADFNLLEKEKTRKATQQRAKFLMDKYYFKIKGYYNMKRDEVIRECFRHL